MVDNRVMCRCARGKATIMMGSKERHFATLIQVSLEELVQQDHFYRHLERTLDLSFMCEFVHEAYAGEVILPLIWSFSSSCNW